MALEKNIIVDKIEVLALGQVQVRTATIVSEDGEELTRSYHRHALEPCYKDEDNNWQDSDISAEDSEVQAICNAKWTDELKESYKAYIDSANNLGD